MNLDGASKGLIDLEILGFGLVQNFAQCRALSKHFRAARLIDFGKTSHLALHLLPSPHLVPDQAAA
jgi:hypothetical protein